MEIIELHAPGAYASAAQQLGGISWSRRRFLKCMGALSIGCLAADLLAPTFPFSAIPRALFEAALLGRGRADDAQLEGLAATVQLLQRAVADLQRQGFPFDLNQHSLVRLPNQPDVIGMLLHDTRIPPYYDGADIALTMNLKAPWLSALHYVIGRSHHAALEIHSSIVNMQDQHYKEHLSSPRVDHQHPVSFASPEQARYHSARVSRGVHVHHHDSQALSAAAPPTIWKESSPWHYDRCRSIAWYVSEGSGEAPIFQLRYDTSSEYRSCRDCTYASAISYGGWYDETRSVGLNWRDSDRSVRPGA